jgi:hypothetical protein
MKTLTLEDILSVNDTPAEEVEVPEWGGSVFVRGMTGGERAEFEDQVHKNLSLKNFKVDLVVNCTVDDEGNRVFQPKHKAALQAKSSKAIERIVTKIFEMSGLTAEGEEIAEGN